jgi:hypothetical protein
MDQLVRKLVRRPSVVLGGMVLLGVLEFVALQRSQWRNRQGDEQLSLPA